MKFISSVEGVLLLFIFQNTIVVITSIEHHAEVCPSEYSTISNSSERVSWRSAGIENEVVLSDPPCIDDSGNLIVRVCTKGQWTPKNHPTCTKTVESSKRCPTNFEETESSCIFITKPRQWEDNCNNIKVSELSSPLTNESVWLPFKRASKYGPYECMSWGRRYGLPLSRKPQLSTDSYNKNCLIMNTLTDDIELEYCNSSHKHICEFSKDERYKCPINCVNAGVNSYNCYCKSRRGCTRFAEVQTVFQKNILSDLAGDELCYIGGTQLFSGYSQALNKHAWLHTNNSLNCSLCRAQVKMGDEQLVHMLLSFEERVKKMFLVIYNPGALFDDASEDTIYCFTDADSFELRKRVYVKKIEEQNSTRSHYKVYEVGLEVRIGQYWCEAYHKFDATKVVRSNKVIGYINKPGNEYALRIRIHNACTIFNCSDDIAESYRNFVEADLSSIKDSEVRVMEIFTSDMNILDMLLHISTLNAKPVTEEYYDLKRELDDVLGEAIEIVHFKNFDFCLPESMYSENGQKIFWPLTPIGRNAIPRPSCLQERALPVFRPCKGNFMNGAEWSTVIGHCDDYVEPAESTKVLYSVLNDGTITDTSIEKVTKVIKHEPNLPVLSIYYVAEILETIFEAQEMDYLDETVATLDITESLLHVDKKSLALAQDVLNLTDVVLDSINEILSAPRGHSDILVIQRDSVAVHSTNPFISNISGVVVYADDERILGIKSLRRNETFENIIYDEYFKIAYYVPEEILEHFENDNITIITTVFFNDHLFVSNYSRKPTGLVMSITIPGNGVYLPSTIPILFKSSLYFDTPECGFWDYGKKFSWIKGHWSTIGGNYMGNFENESYYHLCSFSHLTHFALLILEPQLDESEDFDHILSIITFVGDFFSMCGIIGIFLTALLYKKWRQKQGTVILLNLSVALILEIILMQMIEFSSIISSTGCTIMGKIIHYTVISKFSWMLIYSFLQYMRFVKVFTVLPDNIVCISVLFGWGFGLIPVVIVAAIEPYSYITRKYNFCYPSGLSLYLGLMMPILIIIFINTFVFFAIMREVTIKTVESHGNKDKVLKLQVQLASLLFFVLGVPWLFAIFSNIISIDWIRTSFIYLFSITTNVQGFILFLFYVVFNGETRNFWLRYFSKKDTNHISLSTKSSSKL